MDRVIVYPGALPEDTDILNTNRNALIALGMLAQAALGTTTFVDGLAATQTTVASLSINIGPGSMGSVQNVDNNAYGSLGTDTGTQIVKMGINTGSTTLTLTAPSTTGQSINYLVSAAFAEVDGGATVLPYVNAANPSAPYSGPAGDGVSQYTTRTETVQLTLTAGTPATTGSQSTPATPSGNVPLYIITVAYGQTAITTAQIAKSPAAPFVLNKLIGNTPGVWAPSRNASMSVTTNSFTGTYTADEVSVQAALGGPAYVIPSFNETIALNTTGAGGMDAGSAPDSGYVAIYAIYNPVTQATALVAANATSAVAPRIYAGSNMPAGYTMSSLVSVWPTTSSGKLSAGFLKDRRLSFPIATVLNTSSPQSSLTALSLSSAVPLNARCVWGSTNVANLSTTTTAAVADVAASSNMIGEQFNQVALAGGQLVQNFILDLVTPQQLYYQAYTTPNESATYAIYISAYEI